MTRALALLLLCAAAPAAVAEILWPRPARPALCLPGGEFEFAMRGEQPLYLAAGSREIPLALHAVRARGDIREGRARVPQSVSAGRYDLIARDAAGEVRRQGAVHVRAEDPAEYTLAIVRGPGPSGAEPVDLPVDLEPKLRESGVDLVVVFGAGEESPELEAWLLALPAPAVLCPDGPGEVHRFRFGPDGYLFLAGGLPAESAATHGRLGDAHALRRDIRDARWSVGVAVGYGPNWDIRAQIALFVDDPLSHLLADDTATLAGGQVPWGKTELLLSPALPRGILTLLDVTDEGIGPHLGAPEPPAPEDPAQPQEVAPAAG